MVDAQKILGMKEFLTSRSLKPTRGDRAWSEIPMTKVSAVACLQAGRNGLEEKERDPIWVDEKFHDGGGVFGGKRRKRKKETENTG